MARFTDKVVVVVGGNSGIGLAAARAFAAEGAKLIITGRDPATLQTATAETGAAHFRTDISDPNALAPVVEEIRGSHGRIDVLFVNAGAGGFMPAREVTPEAWDELHAINLRGCFFAIQKALPLMRKGGSIVVTGSIGAVLALPGNVVYAASKAGLRAVVRILAAELIGEGIRVNMVSPGPTETPIINRDPNMDAEAIAALRKIMIQEVPMHRMGEADEIARAVLFLASDDASFISGVDLFVDGGSVELR
jgi:NAD(P)-dependent dehydrogenase (short-subunit alcohol dehydrogenase family)